MISPSMWYECPYTESRCETQTGRMDWPLRSRHRRSARAAVPADQAKVRLLLRRSATPLQPLPVALVGSGMVRAGDLVSELPAVHHLQPCDCCLVGLSGLPGPSSPLENTEARCT